jgi:hypothetical protein
MMTQHVVKGTIDFRHDGANDIVVMTPRWTLDSSVEVIRWYQMQSGYFTGRFQEKKDVIVLNAAFDVTPQVSTLWGQYRARLHELYIRFSVRVANNARVRLATNTSGVRYAVSSIESENLQEAIQQLLALRAKAEEKVSSGVLPRSMSSTSIMRVTMPAMSPPPPSGRSPKTG